MSGLFLAVRRRQVIRMDYFVAKLPLGPRRAASLSRELLSAAVLHRPEHLSRLFGFVLFGALAANLTLAIILRHQRAPFWLPLLAFVLIAATLVIFFTWTYPANQATSNWTVTTENWHELRAQWEYAHAANTVLTFLALCSVTISVQMTRDGVAAADG